MNYFPDIVPEEGEKVKGEVYEIDSETLEGLDFLEGEGSLYIRREVDLDTSEGSMKAFVYIWNSDVDGMEKLNYEDQLWKGAK